MSMDPGPNDLLKDALTSAGIGGAGAAARAALAKTPMGWQTLSRHIFAGGVMAVFVGFGVKDLISSEALRYAVIGVASVVAPELFESLIDSAPAIVKKLAGKVFGRF